MEGVCFRDDVESRGGHPRWCTLDLEAVKIVCVLDEELERCTGHREVVGVWFDGEARILWVGRFYRDYVEGGCRGWDRGRIWCAAAGFPWALTGGATIGKVRGRSSAAIRIALREFRNIRPTGIGWILGTAVRA